jgi:hypothetical protein
MGAACGKQNKNAEKDVVETKPIIEVTPPAADEPAAAPEEPAAAAVEE